MKVTGIDRTVRDILGNSFYRIPRYQRPYSWTPEQILEFWNDAVVHNADTHFIGSMVVFEDRSSGRFEIVDGQQRLTTITMMLAATRDAFEGEGFPNLASGIHRYIERPDLANTPQFVLDTESGYPYMQDHVQHFRQPKPSSPAGDEERLLQQCFETVGRELRRVLNEIHAGRGSTKTKKAQVEKLLTGVRDKLLQLQLIFVQVDDENSAYTIFLTLNARGMDLEVADLIKAHLTKLIRVANPRRDYAKDTWNETRGLLAASGVGINFNTFLHHYWLSRADYVAAKRLYDRFSKSVTKTNARDTLENIKADARTYREILEPGFRHWTREEHGIRDALAALSVFQVTQPLPFVLAVLREYREGRLSKKPVRRALEAVERFHFLSSAVVGQRSSGGISAMYALHGKNLLAAADRVAKEREIELLVGKLRTRQPSFDEFKAAFREIYSSEVYTKQKRLVQYILSRLDGAHQTGVAVDYGAMTIEHLASQRPKGGPPLSDEHVARIGNLLLVTENLNTELANKSFAQKKAVLAKSKAWVDHDILAASDWREKEIDDRTDTLAELAYRRVWHLR